MDSCDSMLYTRFSSCLQFSSPKRILSPRAIQGLNLICRYIPSCSVGLGRSLSAPLADPFICTYLMICLGGKLRILHLQSGAGSWLIVKEAR